MIRLAGAVAVVTASFLVAACGADTASVGDPVDGQEIAAFSVDFLPSSVLDLTVGYEDISSRLESEERAFVDAMGLYSLRSGDLVKATLQVSRFNDEAAVDESGFRGKVLARIGTTVPRSTRLGKREVFVTAGNRQTIAVWFEGRHMLVLAIRDDFERPRSLLRTVLELTTERLGGGSR